MGRVSELSMHYKRADKNDLTIFIIYAGIILKNPKIAVKRGE